MLKFLMFSSYIGSAPVVDINQRSENVVSKNHFFKIFDSTYDIMIGVNKPFSKTLHTKNDPKSRKLVKEFFACRGVILKDNPNKFGIDLMTEDSQFLVEVEHRLNWDRQEFPYDEINVPQRKNKFFSEGNVHYVILSKDYSYLGFINSKSIQKYMAPEYLKESSNRFVKQNEYFYKIPKSEFEFYEIT